MATKTAERNTNMNITHAANKEYRKKKSITRYRLKKKDRLLYLYEIFWITKIAYPCW